MLLKQLSKMLSKRNKAKRTQHRARALRMEALDQRITFDVNQAPVNIVPPAQNYTAEDPTVTFGLLNRVSTSDADANGQDLRVTLFVNSGKIDLGSTAGLTFRNGADGTRYLLFDGSESAINAALLNMKYTANSGVSSDLLTFDVHDLGHTGTGGAKVDRDTISISRAGLATNQAPVNVVPGPQSYGADRTVTFGTLNAISTSDSDAGNLDLRVTLFVNSGTLTLGSTSGLVFRGGANGTRYLLFDGSQNEINNALSGLVYRANSGVTADTLTIDTHDLGHSGSGGAKVDRDSVALTQFGVQPNRAPVNTVPGGQFYTANSRTVTFGAGNRVSTQDPDAGNQNLRVTLFVNSGRINLPTVSGLTFRSGADNTRYMVFDGTQTAINNAMLNMVYTANAGVTADTLTIDTHDLGHTGSGGAKTDRDTVTLTQAGTVINQAPFNTTPGPQFYTNNNRTVTFGAANRIATNDPDVGNANLRVTLFANNGVIKLSTLNGLTFRNGANNTRYLLFDGTQQAINNALLNMTYTANSNSSSDVLTFDVHDLGNTGSGGAKVDRDTVTLTLAGSSGRGAGDGSGESVAPTQAPAARSVNPSPTEESDRVFAELANANANASTFSFIDLLASTNSGRSRSALRSDLQL